MRRRSADHIPLPLEEGQRGLVKQVSRLVIDCWDAFSGAPHVCVLLCCVRLVLMQMCKLIALLSAQSNTHHSQMTAIAREKEAAAGAAIEAGQEPQATEPGESVCVLLKCRFRVQSLTDCSPSACHSTVFAPDFASFPFYENIFFLSLTFRCRGTETAGGASEPKRRGEAGPQKFVRGSRAGRPLQVSSCDGIFYLFMRCTLAQAY